MKRVLAFAVLGAGAIYAAEVFRAFPGTAGLGDDYAYFMPVLLAGKYWIAENGVFALPWFSPAFCGGLPFVGNPQSIYLSLPQALSLIAGPVASFALTTVVFAGAGAIGTYALMRRRFESSVPAAALSAVVFLCNGFLLHRMAVGHATYHAFGLVPLLCYALLTPLDGRLSRAAAPVALAGLMLAYFVFAGALNIVVPVGLVCAAVWLLHALLRQPVLSFWPLGATAGLLAGAIAAVKLAPAAAFVWHFPRVQEIALFDDPLQLAHTLFLGFFLPDLLPKRAWVVGSFELDYGVGLVPLLAALATWLRYRRDGAAPSLVTIAKLAALALLLAIPVFLNFGGPEHAAFLKSLPYIGDNIILVRWFFIYVLPLTLGAGLALDYVVTESARRSALAVGGILVTALPLLLAQRSYVYLRPYDAAGIVAAERALAATGVPPEIERIGGAASGPNDALTSGGSSFPCYEPVFGYGLETFPGGMTPGPLALGGASERHLRNPACYVYGGCAPGTTFGDDERAAESDFASYRPFPFEMPRWQRWANLLSLGGVVATTAGLLLGLLSMRRASRLTAVRRDPSLAG